jgi:hypothetical protein
MIAGRTATVLRRVMNGRSASGVDRSALRCFIAVSALFVLWTVFLFGLALSTGRRPEEKPRGVPVPIQA